MHQSDVAITEGKPLSRTSRAEPRRVGVGARKRLDGRPIGGAVQRGKAPLLSRGSRLAMWGGLGLALGVYAIFGLVPAAGNLLISLTNYSGLPGSVTTFTGASNYVALATTEQPGFVASLSATVIFVTGVTVVQNLVGLAAAHRLRGNDRVSAFLRVLVFLPIVLGVTVVGLVWILILNPAGGPAASLAHLFGVNSAFFGSNTAAMPLVIGVQIWQNTGFTTLVFIGGLQAISPEIYEAASLDGVRAWTRFRQITLPLLTPSVTVNVLLAVVGSFTTYNLIYILTDGLYHTNTLGMLAFNSAFGTSANLGLGAAVTIVLFIFTLCVSLPLLYLFRRHEARLFS